MSVVTSILLTTSGIEYNHREGGWLVDKLNAYLEKRHKCKFEQVDQHSGGNKGFEPLVYMVAINYLDIDAFLDVFRSIGWELPSMVTLLIQQDQAFGFTVYRPGREPDLPDPC